MNHMNVWFNDSLNESVLLNESYERLIQWLTHNESLVYESVFQTNQLNEWFNDSLIMNHSFMNQCFEQID